jgi:4-methylaminobutanoate oxidase (formaldehyde-forming)
LILRDGVGVGQVTSAAFGTTTGACVGLGYVRRLDGEAVTADYLNAQWSVNVGGRIVPLSVSLKAPYDPDSTRVRS